MRSFGPLRLTSEHIGHKLIMLIILNFTLHIARRSVCADLLLLSCFHLQHTICQNTIQSSRMKHGTQSTGMPTYHAMPLFTLVFRRERSGGIRGGMAR